MSGAILAAIAASFKAAPAGPTFTSVATSNFNADADGVFPSAEFTNLDGVNGRLNVVNPTGTSGQFNNPFTAYSGARRIGTFNANQYAEVTLAVLTSATNNDAIGCIVRASTDVDSARDFYFAYVQDTGVPTLTYGKVVNGTVTAFASNSGITTWANGDKLLLYVQGTKVAVKKNRGADLLSTTDASLTTGNPGILARFGAGIARGDDADFGNVS